MDLGTIIGIVVGLVLVVASILLNGSIIAFLDPASFMIVVGGTFAATLVAFPIKSVMTAIKSSAQIFFQSRIDHLGTVRLLLQAADVVRREGPLGAEKLKGSSSFMQTAFELVADGHDADHIQAVLEIEMEATISRQAEIIKILDKMAELAPAWGMIGTLIGLVIMLLNLDDPSSIGPAMAVALLTTFYGALWANLLLSPSAAKLEERGQKEAHDYRLILEGALGMARTENPRAIQQRLLGFMPPQDRADLQAKAMAGGKVEKKKA
ncbi:MAG: MotA/TolQ/ExbB proton channel family protein [Deltaproteobacteria bacterium]|nr:MotA/TolQ/ExbB proton channel family protein [Deltaproteobacteria bacterium]